MTLRRLGSVSNRGSHRAAIATTCGCPDGEHTLLDPVLLQSVA